MKNINLLPTDKPSRLWLYKNFDNLLTGLTVEKSKDIHPQHIYITSDEEIKEGDWVKLFVKHINKEWVHKITKEDLLLYSDFNNEGSKITLTTDQNLIKDGVQAIDDEFLEWFVKNPSCESVETDLVPVNYFGSETIVNSYGFYKFIYKIIIPQEEPKRKIDTCYNFNIEIGCVQNICRCEQEEPKQETIEEALNYQLNFIHDVVRNKDFDLGFQTGGIFGAKWQAERRYSEEEVYKLLLKHQSDYRSYVRNSYPLTWSFDIKDWFEKYKKK
jgi:hypothetical protein